MNYKITINNPGNHIANPLLKLADREFATREEACEAIYDSLYEVIDSEGGCEMVRKGADADAYIAACHDYILREGYASEDGVSAIVEEVTDNA